MLPVTLARGSSVEVAVVEGESYVIHVSGADAAQLQLTIDQSGTYTNPNMPLDVTADGVISPLDALMVINRLNLSGPRAISGPIRPRRTTTRTLICWFRPSTRCW